MIKFTYAFFCKVYNLFFSFYEFIFLKKKQIFNLRDFYSLNLNKRINLNLKNKKIKSLNNNLEKYVLGQKDIDFLIHEIFIQNNLKKKLPS